MISPGQCLWTADRLAGVRQCLNSLDQNAEKWSERLRGEWHVQALRGVWIRVPKGWYNLLVHWSQGRCVLVTCQDKYLLDHYITSPVLKICRQMWVYAGFLQNQRLLCMLEFMTCTKATLKTSSLLLSCWSPWFLSQNVTQFPWKWTRTLYFWHLCTDTCLCCWTEYLVSWYCSALGLWVRLCLSSLSLDQMSVSAECLHGGGSLPWHYIMQ